MSLLQLGQRRGIAAAAAPIPDLPAVRGGLDLNGLNTGAEHLLVAGGAVAGLVVIGLLLYSWFKNRQQHSGEHRWQHYRRNEVAEMAALDLKRRQAQGPDLVLADPERRVGPGDMRLLQRFGDSADLRRVLGTFHAEVDRRLPAGTDVILCVENHGRSVEAVSVELDGQPAHWEHESDRKGPDRREWIRYAYRPDRHGERIVLIVRYCSADGTPVMDRYSTRHGFRDLERMEDSSSGTAAAEFSAGDPQSTPGATHQPA